MASQGDRRRPGGGGISLLFLLTGCFGNDTTEFPPGLEPLEESRAEAPAEVSGVLPETITVVSGESGDYEWAHGTGYLHGTVAEVYAALGEPDVCVDRRAAASWTIERDVEPDYPRSFVVRNVVEDLFTVEFDVTWRFGAAEGTEAEPQIISARYQKTFGTSFIDLLEGSVLAEPAEEEGVTRIEIVSRIDAAASGLEQIEHFVADLHASIAAQMRGDPLPTY